MAHLIPNLNSCRRRMQAGERRVAERLVSHLSDECLCWYELPVGIRYRYADFIILHPRHGLLLLEVKDWKPSTIHSITKTTVTLRTPQGLKVVSNPLEQVRQCMLRLKQKLEQDPLLVDHSEQYGGRLLFPYGYSVVLSNMTRREYQTIGLQEVLPEHSTLCRDEMVERVPPETFQEKLWNMFDVEFSRSLNTAQLDRIRWHLFPEIRVSQEQTRLFSDESESQSTNGSSPDIFQILDIQQEQLARSLGEGHRVIHGAAGSGKTLILIYRCLYLVQLAKKPILVLCYNVTLATWLRERVREMMAERGLNGKIHVHHFHDWCGHQLRVHGLKRPSVEDHYYDLMVETVMHAVETGTIPQAQYGAVLIDEGHDFEPDWLRLMTRMVDPEIGSLLLVYDDAQSIYNRKKPLNFTLSSVGVHARGRTTVLRVNYRNTEEILTLAHRFVSEYLHADDRAEEEIPLVKPQSAGRHGPFPDIKLFTSFGLEAQAIARSFRHLHDEQDLSWADMCVLYRYHWMGPRLQHALAAEGIPCDWLKESQAKKAFRLSQDSVKLMTMHSSKGLEFSVAAVAGLGYLPAEDTDPVEEAKLLYVAMTRSTDTLSMTAHQASEFFCQIQEAAASLKGEPAVCPSR